MYAVEQQYEVQERLQREGYRLVAPSQGCFIRKAAAEAAARYYANAYIVCHTYNGRSRGYLVYAK